MEHAIYYHFIIIPMIHSTAAPSRITS